VSCTQSVSRRSFLAIFCKRTNRYAYYTYLQGVLTPPVEKTLERYNERIPLPIFSVISQIMGSTPEGKTWKRYNECIALLYLYVTLRTVPVLLGKHTCLYCRMLFILVQYLVPPPPFYRYKYSTSTCTSTWLPGSCRVGSNVRSMYENTSIVMQWSFSALHIGEIPAVDVAVQITTDVLNAVFAPSKCSAVPPAGECEKI
jgi:hypothetical protein